MLDNKASFADKSSGFIDTMNKINARPKGKEISIYVHWPFCLSLCPYCDFNSHIYKTIDKNLWLDSYKKEIDFFAANLRHKRIKSIFFGGGTPSLMPPMLVDGIIDKLASLALVDKNTEITLEANPTSYESGKFRAFKDAGINRVSIGVQALNEDDLHKLGRKHNVAEAMGAIKSASSIFDNFSFDLIYARNGQSVQAWQDELRKALEFANNHISLYQLTIEKGTEFFTMHKAGKLILPKDDDAARMYEVTEEELSKKGFHRYEISNYAKVKSNIVAVDDAPGNAPWDVEGNALGDVAGNALGNARDGRDYGHIDNFHIEREKNYCQHNMTYWRYGEYLGIGPGAHSRIHNGFDNDSRENISNIHNGSDDLSDKGSGKKIDEKIEGHCPIEASKKVEAIMMHHKPDKWIDSVQSLGNGIQSRNYLKESEIVEELVMMSLRLREGLYNHRLEDIIGKSIEDVIDIDLARSYHKAGFIDISNMRGSSGLSSKDSWAISSLASASKDKDVINNIRLTDDGVLMHSYITSRLLKGGP